MKPLSQCSLNECIDFLRQVEERYMVLSSLNKGSTLNDLDSIKYSIEQRIELLKYEQQVASKTIDENKPETSKTSSGSTKWHIGI